MLSGVGPAAHIKEQGISVVHDLPGVGARLTDHPVVDLRFHDKIGQSLNFLELKSFSHIVNAVKSLYQYLSRGKGPLASNVSLFSNKMSKLMAAGVNFNSLGKELVSSVRMILPYFLGTNTQARSRTARQAGMRLISRSSQHL
jgi:choline dehydrogenase-like flavoprotein